MQVGHLGEDYEAWVHQPIVSKEGPRFFESDILEVQIQRVYLKTRTFSCLIDFSHLTLTEVRSNWQFLTRTRWWVIPIVWVPVVCWFISVSAGMGHSASRLALLVVTGIFAWTLLEYILHRFLFHAKTRSYW